MRPLLPLALAAALLPAPSFARAPAHGPGRSCPDIFRTFAHKAELPPGVRAVLFPMAERGRPFQVSDALRPGPRLPFSRFVSAQQHGCALALRYEYGGRAHGFATAQLELRGRDWVMVRQR
jgi:hypothetical protein